MDPVDLHLPAILDPILSYLHDTLPQPLYSFILNFLSHCLALLSVLANFTLSLLSRSPAEWDAQTILPPLISLLAAYLAITSIYRTTKWMIRTTFWFLKWGFIIGGLAIGMGWYMGATQTGGSMNSSLVSHFGSLILGAIKGNGHSAGGGTPLHNSRSRRSTSQRPKAWESFDRHRNWQYNEDQTEKDQESDLESLFADVMDMANQVFGEDSWWSGMRRMMANEAAETDGGRARSRSSSRTQS